LAAEGKGEATAVAVTGAAMAEVVREVERVGVAWEAVREAAGWVEATAEAVKEEVRAAVGSVEGLAVVVTEVVTEAAGGVEATAEAVGVMAAKERSLQSRIVYFSEEIAVTAKAAASEADPVENLYGAPL
jgi:prophage DNA circulation protein